VIYQIVNKPVRRVMDLHPFCTKAFDLYSIIQHCSYCPTNIPVHPPPTSLNISDYLCASALTRKTSSIAREKSRKSATCRHKQIHTLEGLEHQSWICVASQVITQNSQPAIAHTVAMMSIQQSSKSRHCLTTFSSVSSLFNVAASTEECV